MKIDLIKHTVFSFCLSVFLILSAGAQKTSKKTSAPAPKPAPTVTLSVDATEAPRKIFHAKLKIPASPGALTLYYPEWLPGEHGPTGPIQNLAGLKFTANGQTLTWRRDLEDGWTFHIEVPAGVTSVEASLDFISPVAGEAMYTAGASATDKLTILAWNTVLLYPAGWSSDEIQFEASLKLPDGWKFGTPLPVASQAGSEIKFKPVSLTTLVDSPVSAAEYMRVVELAPESAARNGYRRRQPIRPECAAGSARIHTRHWWIRRRSLFGAQHFRDYHFLYTLSDHVAHFGLEHHESNDSRLGERYLVDPELRILGAGLLPHEYVHSWNGKYRRPAGLTTPDYQKPMHDDLLWVYEGLTSYLGDVLS